ncbi:MAG: NAD-dependent epimerase/dehydratase family protein [bacterium]|nr:NAD-dependent epimerase/dehydratase family protein [bacterium]
MERSGSNVLGPGSRIAVLGAGYIGMAAARACATAGAAVWTVNRSPRAAGGGITPVVGDLASGDLASGDLASGSLACRGPAGLPEALDAVILAVAPGGGGDSYEATYPPAARAAVALARACGARAVVYTSSTGVYGGRDGAPVDESTPRAGDGPGNRALVAAEDILLGAGLTGVTVLRVAGIYGPGRDPRARFAQPGLLPLRGEYWVNFAHRDDIVAAITGSLGYAGAPRVLNVADGAPETAAAISRWCAVARGIDPASLDFSGEGTPSRSNQRVVNAALVATGWRPRYPSYREGFTSGLQD